MESYHLCPSDYDYSIHLRVFHQDTDEEAARVSKWLVGQLGPFLPTPGPVPVLDIGCGMGFTMLALLQMGFTNVAGVDVDKAMVESCLRKGLDVRLVDDTISYLREYPSRFGLVIMRDVLEHVPPRLQIPMLRAVRAAMNPGGELFVQVPNANWVLACRWRYDDFTHCSSFTEHSIQFVLKNAGFERITIRGEPSRWRPPLRLWSKYARRAFTKWVARYVWRKIVEAELGQGGRGVAEGPNLIVTAFNPGSEC